MIRSIAGTTCRASAHISIARAVQPVVVRSGSLRFFAASAASPNDEAIRLRLKTDLKTAMRAKDTNLSGVIKTLLSDITYAEKSASAMPSIPTIIQRSIKKRRDSAESYRSGGRTDLAEQEEAECKLLEQYLPAQMSEAEIESVVKQIVADVGAKSVKDLGRVMKEVNAKVDDALAPRKAVAGVVKKVLQEMES
ncbi:uncharacterized protein SPPG_03933 [Spizellomyces punctatus DAOM BR117]|uniref:Altered inheritance of mitochondria protein 41 n=1 Tax=Spizellomyces punctatus (strain DAOM BR117) TaxID=645134 RepID=A0A0L0HID8_SPIPD|nr:uncharacterized protein SPPG_03933 [Spizellomyces punctatus DAOM BR117]KND00828.1 hypothetical protein SPPG_03933 [Spizellomyces punctatus DAOM BR117]|eukprot:XP_016608867.1 hypothetical protein SPPG_03933 [Spizellomyces punctatus DAOM BR117]